MQIVLKINGMSCQHCIKAVEKVIESFKPKSYNVNLGEAKIEFDENELQIEQIKKEIEEAGYKINE